MSPISTKPSKLQLSALFFLMLCVLTAEVIANYLPVYEYDIRMAILVIIVASFVFSLIDLALSWLPFNAEISRRVPTNLSLGKWVDVSLDIKNNMPSAMVVKVCDDVADSFQNPMSELAVHLVPEKVSTISYKIKPTERGKYSFEKVALQKKSRFGCWSIHYSVSVSSSTKVYPNFSAIAGYALLNSDNQTAQLGIKKKIRRGEGTDFLQLREYREGDSIRQVDWKATSRLQKLISQEYEDAKDQQVMVMLDSGRRMRSQDDELSHFDHSLNATLLLAHIALKQGDSVSVFSFGNENRFVPAFKGAKNIQFLLHQMYDLYPSNDASDYLEAAKSVLTLNRKRSLVVLVCNLRDEDIDDLLVAVRLLQKRHLVLVANLEEEVLTTSLDAAIEGFDSAIRYAGIQHYNNQTDEAMKQLKSLGVWLITCRPSELSVRVVNSYLQIKHSAML